MRWSVVAQREPARGRAINHAALFRRPASSDSYPHMDGWEDQEIEHCFFLPGPTAPTCYRDPKGALALKKVDKVVLSEVLGDLAGIAAKGK